jgi:bifunctional enzyme CysN/CysC
MSNQRELFRIVVVGHVDHGKSTLIGRLFHDTGSLPEGKEEAIRATCERRGVPFEWAFLMDALQAERNQAITIDTAQIWFHSEARGYVIIDVPGHREFLKNMITGAASADAAVLVVDAVEGVREQSRRHGYLLHLLGIRQVSVVVTKMDMVGFDQQKFDAVEQEITAYLEGLGITPTYVLPVSGRDGDNIAEPGSNLAWYQGPTLLAALDQFDVVTEADDQPLRFPVQDIYKFDQRRILAGRVESGVIRVGDTILFSPVNKSAKVASIEGWNIASPQREAHAGQSIGITLDEQIFVERGAVASHEDRAPIETDVFRARIFWLGSESFKPGQSIGLKLMTSESTIELQAIEQIIDTGNLSVSPAGQIERDDVAEVVLRTPKPLALDAANDLPRSGRFVLTRNYEIVGGGLISMEGYADQRDLITVRSSNLTRVEHQVSASDRTIRNRHAGGVLWFTGLSGAGKSTLAIEAEKELFNRGYQVYVLDGDNVRNGLNTNLGFSPEDRAENIRRVGEVAALFAEAGVLVISAFISPYRSDRDRARLAAGDAFHEIYVEADLATCESRDPKGLYKRARAGEIEDFTGISAPYEAPAAPELVVDTAKSDIPSCVAEVVRYVEAVFPLRAE